MENEAQIKRKNNNNCNYILFNHKRYVGKEANSIMQFFDCEIKHWISVKCLIHRCSISASWRANDYNAELYNCQTFVAVAINELQARSKKGIDPIVLVKLEFLTEYFNFWKIMKKEFSLHLKKFR